MPVAVGDIKIDDKRLRKVLSKMTSEVGKQMPRAINVGVRKTRTNIRQLVARNLGVRALAVNEKVISVNATRGNWNAAVVVSTKKFPLSVYKSFKEKKGGSIYKSAGSVIRRKRAFFAHSKRNKYGQPEVFERTGRSALPIQRAYGSSAYTYVKRVVGISKVRRQLLNKTLAEFKRLVGANVK